jgi:hypothetical protein
VVCSAKMSEMFAGNAMFGIGLRLLM